MKEGTYTEIFKPPSDGRATWRYPLGNTGWFYNCMPTDRHSSLAQVKRRIEHRDVRNRLEMGEWSYVRTS